MTTQTQLFPNKPSHRLFHVEGEGKTARWTEIGASWAHKDGKGFSINCGAIPLKGRIVMREAKEPKAEDGARA